MLPEALLKRSTEVTRQTKDAINMADVCIKLML